MNTYCKRVLLVAADENSYNMARDLLAPNTAQPHGLEWVQTYAADLTALAHQQYDVCLLDYDLGENSGFAMLRAALAFPVPIILLTDREDHAADVAAATAGAADYLVKGHINGPLLERSIRYAMERQRAAETLREKEEFQRTLLENFPNGSVNVFDRDLRYVLATGQGLAQRGLDAAQLVGKALGEVFPPEQVAVVRPYYERVLAGATVEFELRLGKIFYNVNALPLHDAQGSASHIMAVAQNITERKRMEEQLAASEQRLRTIIETEPECVKLLTADLRILEINPAGLKMLEADSLDQVLGQSYLPFVAPAYRQRLQASVAKVWGGEPDQVEYEIIGRSGSRRWMVTNAAPLRDQQNKIIAYLGISRDITEQREATAKLEKSQALLAEAEHLAAMGSWSWNLRTNALTWSDELYRLRGFTPQEFEMTYEKFLMRVDPADQPNVDRVIQQSLRDCQPYALDYTMIRSDGVRRNIHARAAFVFDADHQPCRMFGTAQDVTELKQAEMERARLFKQMQSLSNRLVEAQEMERRSIARELHDEIGQALTGLKLMLEMSASAPSDSSRATEMLGVINDLMARVHEMSLDLRPAVLDDLGLLPALLWHFERYSSQTGVQVDFKHAGLAGRFAPLIETTAYRITQEALTNVARHAQVSGVRVYLTANESSLNLEIEDQGCGFDQSAALAMPSSGLAGMRERALLAHGTLTMQAAPGKGTSIVVKLPLTETIEE